MGDDIHFLYIILTCMISIFVFIYCMVSVFNRNNVRYLSQSDFNKLRIKKLKIKINKEQVECSICFDPIKLEEKIYRIPCEHKFHIICINSWLDDNNTCPLCRLDVFENINV